MKCNIVDAIKNEDLVQWLVLNTELMPDDANMVIDKARKQGALEQLKLIRERIDRVWSNTFMDAKTCCIIKDDIILKRIRELENGSKERGVKK